MLQYSFIKYINFRTNLNIYHAAGLDIWHALQIDISTLAFTTEHLNLRFNFTEVVSKCLCWLILNYILGVRPAIITLKEYKRIFDWFPFSGTQIRLVAILSFLVKLNRSQIRRGFPRLRRLHTDT